MFVCFFCASTSLCLHFPIIQRGGAYAVLIGGWSLAAYLIQWTWGNLKDLIVNHNQWVIGYLVVVGEGQLHVFSFFLSDFLAYYYRLQLSITGKPKYCFSVKEMQMILVFFLACVLNWRDFARECFVSAEGLADAMGEAARENFNLTTYHSLRGVVAREENGRRFR